MSTIGTLPGDRLAGLLADTCHKIQHGGLTLNELALFNQRQNPFEFKRNEHGHILISITGLALTGQQEIDRGTANGLRFSGYAKSCLTSQKEDRYDKCHRLEDGREYMLALVPTKDVPGNCTTADGRAYGASFGYQQPLAGIVPRYREAITNEVMGKMEFWYIAALHDPITNSGGSPDVLDANRDGDGQWIHASWGYPDYQWGDDGAFAFVVPAS